MPKILLRNFVKMMLILREKAKILKYEKTFSAEFPAPEYVVEGYEPKHPLKVWSDVRQRPYICQYCSKSYPDSR